MVEGSHWDQWFSDGFGGGQPSVTMVFDGCAPLVRRWNGYVPSLKSRWGVKTYIWMQANGKGGVFIYPDLETCLVNITILHIAFLQLKWFYQFPVSVSNSDLPIDDIRWNLRTMKFPGGYMDFWKAWGGEGGKAWPPPRRLRQVTFTLHSTYLRWVFV